MKAQTTSQAVVNLWLDTVLLLYWIVKSTVNTVTLTLPVYVHVTPLHSYKAQEFTVLVTS